MARPAVAQKVHSRTPMLHSSAENAISTARPAADLVKANVLHAMTHMLNTSPTMALQPATASTVSMPLIMHHSNVNHSTATLHALSAMLQENTTAPNAIINHPSTKDNVRSSNAIQHAMTALDQDQITAQSAQLMLNSSSRNTDASAWKELPRPLITHSSAHQSNVTHLASFALVREQINASTAGETLN
jgi:hypothetical protein